MISLVLNKVNMIRIGWKSCLSGSVGNEVRMTLKIT